MMDINKYGEQMFTTSLRSDTNKKPFLEQMRDKGAIYDEYYKEIPRRKQ